MNGERLYEDSLRKKAEELYRQYHIAVQEHQQKVDIDERVDTKPVRTIKLSNSTTPMACYN